MLVCGKGFIQLLCILAFWHSVHRLIALNYSWILIETESEKWFSTDRVLTALLSFFPFFYSVWAFLIFFLLFSILLPVNSQPCVCFHCVWSRMKGKRLYCCLVFVVSRTYVTHPHTLARMFFIRIRWIIFVTHFYLLFLKFSVQIPIFRCFKNAYFI